MKMPRKLQPLPQVNPYQLKASQAGVISYLWPTFDNISPKLHFSWNETDLMLQSHNTLVTSLTNFPAIPGHTFTSIRIPDSQNLCFAFKLDANPVTLSTLTSLSMSRCLQTPQIMEGPYLQPYLLFIVQVSPLVPVQLCFPVSPIHVTSLPVSLYRTSDTPDLMLCSLFQYIRLSLCMYSTCSNIDFDSHFHCLLDPLCDSELWFHTSRINSSFHLNSMLNLSS